MRGVLGVVSGYLIFALSAVLYFRLANVDPHSPAAVGFEMLTIAYGLVFAMLGGFIAGKIARRTGLMSGILLALVIVLGATVSIIARPGAGALWSQTAALLLFAPASVAGDWLRVRGRRTA